MEKVEERKISEVSVFLIPQTPWVEGRRGRTWKSKHSPERVSLLKKDCFKLQETNTFLIIKLTLFSCYIVEKNFDQLKKIKKPQIISVYFNVKILTQYAFITLL